MSRVIIDQGAVDLLLQEPGVAPTAERGARAVARAAAQVAPRNTGRLRRSYRATAAEETAKGVVATAYTDDPAGHLAEWGSVNNEAYAPLRRGADRVGLQTRVAPKASS